MLVCFFIKNFNKIADNFKFLDFFILFQKKGQMMNLLLKITLKKEIISDSRFCRLQRMGPCTLRSNKYSLYFNHKPTSLFWVSVMFGNTVKSCSERVCTYPPYSYQM